MLWLILILGYRTGYDMKHDAWLQNGLFQTWFYDVWRMGSRMRFVLSLPWSLQESMWSIWTWKLGLQINWQEGTMIFDWIQRSTWMTHDVSCHHLAFEDPFVMQSPNSVSTKIHAVLVVDHSGSLYTLHLPLQLGGGTSRHMSFKHFLKDSGHDYQIRKCPGDATKLGSCLPLIETLTTSGYLSFAWSHKALWSSGCKTGMRSLRDMGMVTASTLAFSTLRRVLVLRGNNVDMIWQIATSYNILYRRLHVVSMIHYTYAWTYMMILLIAHALRFQIATGWSLMDNGRFWKV